MNNNSGPLWSCKKFNNKAEARRFLLSEKGNNHISYLGGVIESLYDKARTEPLEVHGHGYPAEPISSIEAGYASSEHKRLCDLRDYFREVPAKLGYKWVYDNTNHSVHQEIDLTNVSPAHPVFIEYCKDQKLNIKEYDEAYRIWLKSMTEGGINNAFKLAYHFKLKDLIPDSYTLTTIIKKKS